MKLKCANSIKETVKGYQVLPIEDVLLDKRKIFLTEEVNSETMSELLKQLMYLENEDNTAEIMLYINSPGGEVSSGLAVFDYMMQMKSPITTVCVGTAASMGSILFLAGDKRLMFKNTKVMIHDPSVSGAGCSTKALELEKRLNNLMDIRKTLCKIIAERTGKSLKTIYKKTKDDYYFGAKEAIEFGIATEIIKKEN